MCEVLDRVEQKGITKGRAAGRKEGAIEQLCSLVCKGLLALNDAIRESNLSESDFMEWMHKLHPDFKV